MEIIIRPRKIVCFNYSYFVSLPIDWAKTHNIGKGDKVQPIILENGDLLLKPVRNNEVNK